MRIDRWMPAVAALGVMAAAAHGQLSGVYEFDAGGDGTSWDDALNWERITDPNGAPISGNPPAPPNATTSADLPLPGVVIDGSMPGQTALDVSIGTVNGAGSLNMSGGGLTIRDLFIGADTASGVHAGALTLSGGALIAGDDITVGAGSGGTMTVTNGTAGTADDLIVNANSSLVVTGGVVNVGDRLSTTGNGSILVNGGTIRSDDDFYFGSGSEIAISSGLMEVIDKLRFIDEGRGTPGQLTIDGGIVRSQEYGLEGADRGLIEINGDGVFQVDQSQLSIAEAMTLIAEGVHLTTSELAPLGATSVVVPDFFGQTNVVFTQISVIPAPGGGLLLSLVPVALCRRRRS